MRWKCDGTRAEVSFRLSAKRTSPFKSAGASAQSTTGSRGVRISGSNVGYTMFRGRVKSTGYPRHSPVSPSLPFPCVTVCHHISTGPYIHTRKDDGCRPREIKPSGIAGWDTKPICHLLAGPPTSFFPANHKCFQYDFFSFCKKVAIIYLLTRHEICDEEHQTATFSSDIISEEMRENEVGRVCRYRKCKRKLHNNGSHNT